jgi:uncharacterized protein (TIGR02996 family)
MDLGALFAKLRTRPLDWESWLVYADWLTDQGDARGVLVGLEHKLATATLSEQERQVTRQQIQALEQEHQARWLQGWEPAQFTELKWRHGFVEQASLFGDPDVLDRFEALAAHPTGRLLRELTLVSCGLGDREAARLARCPALRSLATLNLNANQIGPEGAEVLAQSVSGLQTLLLGENPIGATGAAALAGCGGLGSLSSLGLCGCGLGPEGAEALARSETLRSLTTLELGGNALGPGGVAELARSERLPSLAWLELDDNRAGDDGAAALATSPARQALVHLDLHSDEIGDRGARALAGTETLPSLRWLNLNCNEIGDEGARALAAARGLGALQELALRSNLVGDEGALALARGPVRSLDLADNPVGDEVRESLYGRVTFG